MPKIKGLYGIKTVEDIRSKDKDVIEYIIESDNNVDVRRPLFFAMAELGYPIIELKSMDMTLEDIFIQLVTEEKEVG